MKRVNVHERVIYPATAIVHWLDGTSAADQADMLQVTSPLIVEFDDPIAGDAEALPADVRILHKPGGFAFWQTGEGSVVPETQAEDADYEVSSRTAYRIRGSVSDPTDRFLPRTFDITVAAFPQGLAERQAVDDVVLYPSPLGTRVPTGGALFGTLQWEADDEPVPWALLEVRLAATPVVAFRAQSDLHGDFILPMPRLPALREGITEHAVELRIAANTAAGNNWQEPGGDTQVEIGQLALGGSPDDDPASAPIPFSDVAAFNVSPGAITKLRTIQQRPEVIRIRP